MKTLKVGIMSYEEMKKRKPDIIHASLNAFGYDGPWAERPGWARTPRSSGSKGTEFGRARSSAPPWRGFVRRLVEVSRRHR